MRKKTIMTIAICLLSTAAATGWAETTIKTRIGKLAFTSGYPTEKTAQQLYDELDFQRAVQAYLWALPMASYGAMADEHIRVGCGSSAVLIADELAEQQHLVLTANQDTPYMSGVLDLRNGPMVMEVPAGLLGTLNNIWQQPLCDLGGPFSPEQNRGGRFLILPPGYDEPLPAFHHHVVASDSNIVVFYLRGIPMTRDDLPKLVEHIKTYRQYKLSEAKEPPPTKFISLTGKEANLLTHEGFEYFKRLARYIDENPPRSQDMAMLGMLETLGIAHGRPFEPDARMQNILTQAAEVGRAMAKTLAWQPRIPEKVLYAYPGKRQWKNIFFGDPIFHTADYMAIDQRSKYAFEAIGTAKSMVVAVPGLGSQYIGLYKDADGKWLSGEHTYKIHLPKDVPAAWFWSLTAYDNETRSLIQNDLGRPLVGSVHGAKANDDGSFDAYFGPKLPDGVAEANWVQTRPNAGCFIYLRLYGPEQSYFDKTWIPGDAERVK
ncbi:conserved exported hypothetical protein [Desulfosarcina cetonica]|uniref:DUF1254 domain-containing protein n=1 Tax=Desulfosarcina cetonica TaxID=90730 RepID=UPI0006D063C7|nr:DUF1254 domain-containing protein [Desulfosarcina cetonica]VTR65418.1 conserved exported hypothetical protein [Desulfosarcina cetonica]